MNIGMVLQNKFPPDIRVEKEAKALIKTGHRLYLLTRSSSAREEEQIVNGIHVRGIPLFKTRLRRAIDTLVFAYTYRDRIWEKEIKRFVKDYAIDVLHIHDLPLVGPGIRVAHKYSIPIVADLHENYPAAIQVWETAKTWLHSISLDYDRWAAYEQWCLARVDRIIVVIQEAKERLISNDVAPDKITIVSNCEDLGTFNGYDLDQTVLTRHTGHFVVSYVGGFGPDRGIDCAIRAMTQVKEHMNTARLLLVGGMGIYLEEMQELVEALGLEESVQILDWQPFEKVATYIKASDVCLVPHYRNAHTDTTIPHKLFQYMLLGKPVVVSDCRPLKRIVEETRCGLVFETANEKDLAEKIIELGTNQTLRESYGENGKAAVMEKYNWENVSKELCKIYKNLR